MLLLTVIVFSTVRGAGVDSLFYTADTIPELRDRIDWLNLQALRMRTSSPQEAMQVMDSTLVWSKLGNLPEMEGKSHNLYGILHKHLGNYDRALEHYRQALTIFRDLGFEDDESACLNNIGAVYKEQDDFPSALGYYQQSLAVTLSMGDSLEASIRLYNIGEVYQLKGDLDSALYFYDLSLEIERAVNNDEGIYYALDGIGSVYKDLGQYDKALNYHRQALALARTLQSPGWIAETQLKMGRVHLGDSRPVDALILFERATEQSLQIGNRRMRQELYGLMSEAHDANGDGQLALMFLRKQVALKDSIRSQETSENLSKYNALFDTEKKEHENALLRKQQEADAEKFTWLSLSAGSILALAFFVFWGYRNKRKANALLAQNVLELEKSNHEIQVQQKQLATQSDEIRDQRDSLEKAHLHITDSIEYARRIQDAILPRSHELEAHFADHFVYYRPKDIVSGDFYWMHEGNGCIFFAVADCTGHGVPGAFMSIVGHALLEKAVKQLHLSGPAEVLQQVSADLYQTLRKGSNTDVKDGMDLGLMVYDPDKKTLRYVGAHHPMYLVRKGELTIHKGDSVFLGREEELSLEDLTVHQLALEPDDCIYLFSDGYADQKGGPRRKKFYYPPFRSLLSEMQGKSMTDQAETLASTMEAWRGDHEQIDDMLVVGLKVQGEKKAGGTLHALYESTSQGKVLSSFYGAVEKAEVNTLLSEGKEALKALDIHPAVRKKSYNVLVECLENIQKHQKVGDPPEAMMVMQEIEDGIAITIANYVASTEIEALSRRIDELNALDRDGLKARYRQQIEEGRISERGGAGLGLLDVRLKSGAPIQYAFHNRTEAYAIFTLESRIKPS